MIYHWEEIFGLFLVFKAGSLDAIALCRCSEDADKLVEALNK